MIGHLVACYGAADRYLGMLAATLGEADRADAHFERAMELNRRMGAPTWIAHTAYEHARLLLARGPAERDRAQALLGEAASARGAHRHAGAPRPHPGPGLRHAAGRRAPTGSRPARSRSWASSPRGSATARSAPTLFISEHTAANHIRSILRKTGSANRTEAASYAHRHGLIEP